MRKGVLAIFTLLLLVSCSPGNRASQAYYGLYEQEMALVAFSQKGRLAVILLPSSLIDSYAEHTALDASKAFVNLVGLPPSKVVATSKETYLELQTLLTTLATAARGVEVALVDDQVRLEVLAESAGYLRKTELADTLAQVSGLEDPLASLQTIKEVQVLDMRTVMEQNTETIDWDGVQAYLKQYLEMVRRYQQRSRER
ncbi:MAG: hypothetical protein VB127_03390 [Sphaerochaeta sp.]|nr:hypothetical protein [Sphaerochaeta sp.]